MLLDIPGLEYRFCADPQIALAEATAFEPTVILQDLIMPGVDGIEMVRAFRANAKTASTRADRAVVEGRADDQGASVCAGGERLSG